jgi:hypothetical protein
MTTKKKKLNVGIDGPHNVIFTRDESKQNTRRPTFGDRFIAVWGISEQVHKSQGVWLNGNGGNVGLLTLLSVSSFKSLFGFTLPKGKAVNGRMTLRGGMRTR